ncbi:hydroxycinnamic acid degradation regulator [Aurantiacibacter arachoides]|nr:hydroxycinnamic acid degradation regulator [Aurantiacibacter arachoides]
MAIDDAGQGLDYGFLADRIGFLLRMASVINLAQLARDTPDKAHTSQRMSVLALVAANPGTSQVRLSEALRLSRPAATLAVDFWQERGCMERRVDPDDRRSYGLFLTPAGEALVPLFAEISREAEVSLRDRLTEAEAVELRRLLVKIID